MAAAVQPRGVPDAARLCHDCRAGWGGLLSQDYGSLRLVRATLGNVNSKTFGRYASEQRKRCVIHRHLDRVAVRRQPDHTAQFCTMRERRNTECDDSEDTFIFIVWCLRDSPLGAQFVDATAPVPICGN